MSGPKYVVKDHIRPDRQTLPSLSHKYAGRRRLSSTRLPWARTIASVRPIRQKVKLIWGVL